MADEPAPGILQRAGPDDLIAHPHTAPAKDAVLVVADKEWVVVLVERAGQLELV